jgi:hypothetical protein
MQWSDAERRYLAGVQRGVRRRRLGDFLLWIYFGAGPACCVYLGWQQYTWTPLVLAGRVPAEPRYTELVTWAIYGAIAGLFLFGLFHLLIQPAVQTMVRGYLDRNAIYSYIVNDTTAGMVNKPISALDVLNHYGGFPLYQMTYSYAFNAPLGPCKRFQQIIFDHWTINNRRKWAYPRCSINTVRKWSYVIAAVLCLSGFIVMSLAFKASFYESRYLQQFIGYIIIAASLFALGFATVIEVNIKYHIIDLLGRALLEADSHP